MKKGIVHWVKIINVFLFFFACLIITSLVSYELYKSVKRDSYHGAHNSIQITDENAEGFKKPIYKKSFVAKYDDVYLFRIMSDRLVTPIETGSQIFKMYNSFGGSNEDFETVNFLFSKIGHSPTTLLPENALIIEFLRKSSSDDSEESYNSYGNNFTRNKHVFSIVQKDTNADQILDLNDRLDLMSAEYDGANLTLIAQDIESFEFIAQNIILITKPTNQGYIVYNLELGTNAKLDVNQPQ